MNNTNKKLTINALSAIIQVTFTAILYFFLYKYLIYHLGVKLLGVWSLILSFSSIANLANMGLTSGLVKFVAEYLAEKKYDKIGKLILTSLLSLAILFSIFSLVILFGAKFFLHFVIDKEFLTAAFSILPWSLASLCVNACSGVFTSVLEGYQKNYLRNYLYIFSGIVMFVVTIVLTPNYHIQGVAIAQFMQAIFILFVSLILIIQINSYNRISNWKWSTKSFKELFDYGYKFQAVSICQLLYEPTTKMLLSKFGGLALLGHYEMATRLVNQFRSLLVNANQVVIPVIAETVKTKSKAYLQDFYANMNRIMSLFTFTLSTLLIVFTPFVSLIWIGNINHDFTFAVYILTISSIFNIMSGPAYFSCMGSGRLNILVLVHILMAILNLVIGYLLGQLLGGYGIILSWGIAQSVGSIILSISFNKQIAIGYKEIFTKNEKWIILLSIFIILISILTFSTSLPLMNNYLRTLLCCLLLLLYIPIVLRNENFKKILLNFRKN